MHVNNKESGNKDDNDNKDREMNSERGVVYETAYTERDTPPQGNTDMLVCLEKSFSDFGDELPSGGRPSGSSGSRSTATGVEYAVGAWKLSPAGKFATSAAKGLPMASASAVVRALRGCV